MASRRLLAAAAVALLGGCQAARVAANRCVIDHVAGEASLDVAAEGSTRSHALAGEGARNGEPGRDPLLQSLLGGAAAPDTGVVWALTSTDGARLVVSHPAHLSAGTRLEVAGPPGRRDWGAGPALPPGTARAAVEVPGLTPAPVTGTIEVLRTAPVQLRLDLRTGTARVGGTVRFRRATEERPCFS
ncbi:MAG TPA: hypothetical protein VEA99_16490 [Gemmatimonadaceae bacterium]|nr:hypothetical protein [Gemmatimonadaceae bacterium]